jgi:hypothetical protein
MQCPKCQFENPATKKFCGKCGHDLTIASDSDQKEISFEEKLDKIQRYFPIGLIEKILAQRNRIDGERRQVKAMFCHVEDFTTLSERLCSEEAYNIMD